MIDYNRLPEIDAISPAEIEVRAKRKGYRTAKKSFAEKRDEIFENAVEFILENNLQNGQIIQLQNPSEKGIYSIVCGKNVYENVLLQTTGGDFHFVASYSQAKNSGIYQRKATRVLESYSYLVSGLSLVPLFGNHDWLTLKHVQSAMSKLEKFFHVTAVSDIIMAECKIKNLLLKAARVQKFCDKKGHEKFIVVSMNSGKIWILNPEELEIIADVSEKVTIMTQFICIRQITRGDYIVLS